MSLLWSAAPAWSQIESEPPRPPSPPAETSPAPASPRSVPRLDPADDDIPPYHFSPLKLTGTVDPDGKFARLQAEIEVHINHPGAYFDVPLRLTQAAITKIDYEGPQEPVPVQPSTPDDGVHWLFRGAGRHRLRLDLVVELRSHSGGTNLQLTLPSGSRFFTTQLQLTIPQTRLTVDAPENHTIVADTSTSGSTLLNVVIAGNRVDLTWRTALDRQGHIARVMTAIAIDPMEERLRLQATQDLITDGQVSEVRVRLPPGFQLLSLGGRDYSGHRLSESSPGWVDVQLIARDRTDLQLEWLLESATSLRAGALNLEGFDLQGALSQTGTIGIAVLPGFKVYRLTDDEDHGVYPEEPRRLRLAKGIAQYKWAWRFERAPFELALDVQEQRPVFDVRTRAILTTETDRMVLDLEYLVQVHVGRLTELQLRWPAPGVDQWTLQAAPESDLLSDATDERSQFLGEFQRITFPSPRDGEFSIRLRFQRPTIPGRFESGLPRVEAERMLPAWLLVRGVDAVEPQLDENAELAALTDASATPWLQEQFFDASRDQAYRVDDPLAVISGVTNLYGLELHSESVVRLLDFTSDGINVEQAIQLDVRYGRIEELVLNWPAAFLPAWRTPATAALSCRLATGEPVAIEADTNRLQLIPPAALRGRVELLLSYRLPVTQPSSPLTVPVFDSPEAPNQRVLVELAGTGSIQARPHDEQWQRVPTALRPTWVAAGSPNEFAANLSTDVRSAPQRYRIETAFAQVKFDAGGNAFTVVEYDLHQPPPEVVVELPSDVSGVSVHWNEQAVLSFSSDRTSNGGVRLGLSLATSGTPPEGRLRLEYRTTIVRSLDDLRAVPVALPIVPEAVISSATQVELELPGDYLMLTYPLGLTPQFQWRPGLVFQRELTPAYLGWKREFRSAIAASGSQRVTPATAGNAYAFWTTGEVSRVEFRVVRLWVLILIGSGLTLAVAFLLWSAAVLRNVLTILCIGFGVAVAGVFVPEAVELLLQPVLLGLLAAVAAISVQVRRPDRDLRPLDDPSTRSEHPSRSLRHGNEGSPPAVSPPSQIGARELQESGSRP